MTTDSSSHILRTKPGARIVLDPSIKQPEDVFTPATYREFLERWKRTKDEYERLYELHLRYKTAKERLNSPESKQMDPLLYQFRLLSQEYRRRLPIHLLARCPYCGSRILRPMDTFSLIGYYPFFNVAELYHGGVEWRTGRPPRKTCKHAVVADFSIHLNGLTPDDLAKWVGRARSLRLSSEPIVLVWLLIAKQTSAVIHALPVGRLDDPEPIHRYTAYFITYFASDETNLYSEAMWVPTDVGLPATGAVEIDNDVVKWVKAGRLLWLDPTDPDHPLVRGPVEAFPYANIQPKGWYEILPGGQVNGPNPYYSRIWQGAAPLHDESFPHTIEER